MLDNDLGEKTSLDPIKTSGYPEVFSATLRLGAP